MAVAGRYGNAGGWKDVVAVTAATLTPTATQNGTLFTNAGGQDCVVTLPTIAAGLRYGFYQEAGFKMVITAASAGTLVVFNDAAGNSITADQAGMLIGTCFEVVPNANASKWLVFVHIPTDLASFTSGITIVS